MSSVDKFVHDSNKAPDSPPHPHTFSSNQRHCFHCKDMLGDGEFCQRCTCMRCGSYLSKGLCLICASRYGNNPNPNSLNDSPNISENVSQSPPLIDHHCCYGCGDSLDGIFSQQCTCESCGNDAHYGYNFPPQVPIIYNPEPSFTYDSIPNFVDDSPNLFNPPSQPPTYSCEFCGNDAHYGYDCPPQVSFIYNPEPCYNQDDYRNEKIDIQYRRECEIKIDELKQNFNGMSIEIRKKEKELLQQEQAAYVRTSQRFNFIDDDDDDEYSFATQEYLKKFSSAITPDLPKSDSLIMEDKHLDTIPTTESDELIKSSVEDLVHTPSESDGISESEYDLPVCDDSSPKMDDVLDDIISIPPGNGNDHFNAESSLIKSVLNRDNVISSPKIDFFLGEFAGKLALIAPIPPGIVKADFDPKGGIRFIENLMYNNSFSRPPETLKDDTLEDDSETVIDSNNNYSSSDNDSLYSDDIDYVEASPPDSELVSLEVVEIVISKVGGIDTDILLTIKDNILLEIFLNVNLLIAKIEALKDNPTPSYDFISSGNPTSYSDLSLPYCEAFFCDSKPDSGDFTIDVVKDIFDNPTREPRVHVPIVLPTHPTLHLDSDITLSSDSLGSDLVVSFPSGTRNKIFDPGILIEVQSEKFLSQDEFSISFIRDPLSLVIDTLLLFLSKNEDKVVNSGILAADEEKSPHPSSHRGLRAFNESPMMIYGGNIPILDDCLDFEASRARGFVLRSLELQSSSSFWKSNILILSTNVYL
ncbi:hypothetical protein Tco_0388615 [Tanacetum coccineum]